MALSFAFDGNDQSSFEQMKRKQKIAEVLYAQASRGASNVGEGLTALGAAIGGRMAEGRANKLESAGRDAANASFGQLFGGAPSSPDSAMATPSASVAVPSDIDSIIIEAASKQGVDPNAMRAIAKLESSFNPTAKNPRSSAGGLFQFIDSTAKDYGLADRFDPAQASDAAARLARDNSKAFESRLGRAPTAGELYLMHQQGAGGALKLLSNPNARAVDIVGGDAVRLNGGNTNMTAGEFANLWVSKADRALAKLGGQSQEPQATQVASLGNPNIVGIAPASRSMDEMMNNPQSYLPTPEQQAAKEGIRRNAQMVPPAMMAEQQSPVQAAVQTQMQGMERPQNPVSQALMSRVQQRVAPQAPQGQPWERGEMIDPVTGEYMQGTWNGQRGQGNPLVSALMGRIQGRQAPQSAPQQPAQALSAPQGGIAPQQAQTAPQRAPAAQQGQPSQQQLIAAMGNPFLTDAQRAMAKMMFERQYMQDPMQQQMSQLELQKRQLELEQMRNPQPKLTDDMREYNFAREQGYEGSFTDFMTQQRKAGATTVNVGQSEYGTIPQGYQLVRDPESGALQMSPIPGGPADKTQQEAAKDSNAMTASDIITSAAQRAREAYEGLDFGSAGAGIASYVPWTDSAELYRQTEVLRAQAKVENLNAMRAASPTGGALGSVTEKESAMLADKSGALDPQSPNYLRDLADYERTLLRTIHGREAGDELFNSIYAPSRQQQSAPTQIQSKEQYDALPSGATYVAPDGSLRTKP